MLVVVKFSVFAIVSFLPPRSLPASVNYCDLSKEIPCHCNSSEQPGFSAFWIEIFCCPLSLFTRYNYFPNVRGGVSGFGQAPASRQPVRDPQDDAGPRRRHNWGQGQALGGQWVRRGLVKCWILCAFILDLKWNSYLPLPLSLNKPTSIQPCSTSVPSQCHYFFTLQFCGTLFSYLLVQTDVNTSSIIMMLFSW